MNFQYNYNLRGSARKPLVEAVSQMLNSPAVYQGAPSFAYIVGGCHIDRMGVLTLPEDTNSETANNLIRALQQQGFVGEDAVAKNTAEETVIADGNSGVASADTGTIPEQPDKLIITVPDTGFTPLTRENLQKIVASKETLLKQALKTETLDIKEADGEISFPWFTRQGLEGEADAYSRLITAICKMAKTQKRVTATEKPVENAKFTMRLFLIRLGFIGDEYKSARKILLRNLTGNSSWKSGHQPERLAEDTANAEPIESITALASEDTEEPLENKGGEDYGKK